MIHIHFFFNFVNKNYFNFTSSRGGGGGGVIIPLSSAIRGSQHSYIEDPNYFRTQNVPGLHTLMNARKTYHIYIHNYPNFACTKITPGLHTQLPQFCMYEKHARPTEKKTEDRPKIEPGLWSRGAPEDGPRPVPA